MRRACATGAPYVLIGGGALWAPAAAIAVHATARSAARAAACLRDAVDSIDWPRTAFDRRRWSHRMHFLLDGRGSLYTQLVRA
ncbi:MAG: hypothetical protein ACREPE_16435, partial [Lysobacter sp.]